MCLAVPGKILEIKKFENKNVGLVDFNGVKKDIPLSLVPNAKIGDNVLVHAGFAIEIIDDKEAEKTNEVFDQIMSFQ